MRIFTPQEWRLIQIEADRQVEAKRLGIACKPLKEPSMAVQLAAMGQEPQLMSLMSKLMSKLM